MVFVVLQPGIIDVVDAGVRVQEFGDLHRVLGMALHPHGERLQSEVGVERRLRGRIDAEVARKLDARLGDIRRAAERLGVAQAVVGLVRLGERRVFAVAPVEVAAVDDGAADLNGVAVDVLRRRMDDDVGAPIQSGGRRSAWGTCCR